MTQEVHLRDLRGQAGCSLDLPFCLSSSGMANICSQMSRAGSRPSGSPVWKSRVRGVLLPHDTEAPSPAGELLHTEQGRGGTQSSRGGGPEGGCAPGDAHEALGAARPAGAGVHAAASGPRAGAAAPAPRAPGGRQSRGQAPPGPRRRAAARRAGTKLGRLPQMWKIKLQQGFTRPRREPMPSVHVSVRNAHAQQHVT